MSENMNLIQQKLYAILENSNDIVKKVSVYLQSVKDSNFVFTGNLFYEYLQQLNSNLNQFNTLLKKFQNIINKKNSSFLLKIRKITNKKNKNKIQKCLEQAFYWNKQNLKSELTLLNIQIRIIKIRTEKFIKIDHNTKEVTEKESNKFLNEIKKCHKSASSCCLNLNELLFDLKTSYKIFLKKF